MPKYWRMVTLGVGRCQGAWGLMHPGSTATFRYEKRPSRFSVSAIFLPTTMADEQTALLARLHAKPNKVEAVRRFLEEALPLAEDEEETLSWYALQIDDTTFGIFDTFAGEDGRQAHLDGEIATALMERADELLEEPPQIEHVDVLAAK